WMQQLRMGLPLHGRRTDILFIHWPPIAYVTSTASLAATAIPQCRTSRWNQRNALAESRRPNQFSLRSNTTQWKFRIQSQLVLTQVFGTLRLASGFFSRRK